MSTPSAPVYLGDLPTRTANSTWRGIKVFADHAFIVSEAANHGMQVFDLTQLRDVTSPPVTFTETAHYAGFGSTHTLAMNSPHRVRLCRRDAHLRRRASRRRRPHAGITTYGRVLQPRWLHARNAVRRLRGTRQRLSRP